MLNWGVELSYDSNTENLERLSLIASGLFILHLTAERASPKIIACTNLKDRGIATLCSNIDKGPMLKFGHAGRESSA